MRPALPVFAISFILYLCAGCNSKSANEHASEANLAVQSLGAVVHPVVQYPSTDSWEFANETQRQRAVRSFAELKKRNVPVYDGPLFVGNDDEVKLQSAEDVARRALVLWAVELRAEGVSKEETIGLIEKLDLWESVSPNEEEFLKQDVHDAEQARQMVWRLESVWVLLWALGHVDDLGWPGQMCDVKQLVAIIEPQESNVDFIRNAKLRSKAEILDAQDLTMRIHWAIRDAYLHGAAQVPENLDWRGSNKMIPLEMSPAVGVVEQRHYVLNWLVNFLDPENWDNVDTPT